MLKKTTIQINCIHCKSCKVLIEAEVDVLPGVRSVDVDYVSGRTSIEFDDNKIDIDDIFRLLKKMNYEPLFLDNKGKQENRVSKYDNKKINFSGIKDIVLGALIPLSIAGLIGGYFLIQNFGGFQMLAMLNEGNVGYGIIFVIGLLTGFHCIGMCGGLVVAYSAKDCKNKKIQCPSAEEISLIPHLQYNIGRFTSYVIVGGILGGVGSFFGVNPLFTGFIIVFSGTFMLLMGLSFLLDWEILEKIKLRTPQFIARFLYNQKNSKKPKGPLVIGLLNGLMPCGPLQAMQLYALASGTVLKGATSLGVYALGTVPLMFGFGAFLSVVSKKYITKITKISGVLIIILGLFMANRGFANFGYSIGIQKKSINTEIIGTQNAQEFQEVKMELGYYGYQPNVLYIKRGVPVRWIIDVKAMSGCTDSIMIESLGIKQDLYKGENIIEFTPPSDVDEIDFSCWMRMVWGKFVVR